MSVFIVVGGRNNDALADMIEQNFPGEYLRAFPTAWLVNAGVTTKELSSRLNLPDGKSGSQAIVMPVTNYAGWAPKNVWEWLRSREAVATNE